MKGGGVREKGRKKRCMWGGGRRDDMGYTRFFVCLLTSPTLLADIKVIPARKGQNKGSFNLKTMLRNLQGFKVGFRVAPLNTCHQGKTNPGTSSYTKGKPSRVKRGGSRGKNQGATVAQGIIVCEKRAVDTTSQQCDGQYKCRGKNWRGP